MYAKEIKKGMKVVPVVWTASKKTLKQSEEWKKVREDSKKPDKFLYVTNIIQEPGMQPRFVLKTSMSSKSEGEEFAAIDLREFPWEGWDCRKSDGKAKAKKATKPAKKAVAKKASAKKAKPAAKNVHPKKAAATRKANRAKASKPAQLPLIDDEDAVAIDAMFPVKE